VAPPPPAAPAAWSGSACRNDESQWNFFSKVTKARARPRPARERGGAAHPPPAAPAVWGGSACAVPQPVNISVIAHSCRALMTD